MTSYALPTALTVHGVFKFTLISEYAGLTIPTIQTVISPGRIHKEPFVTLSKQEVGTLEMKIRDDRTVYPEGFWFKVLSGQHEIRITLDEGGHPGEPWLDLIYFFGYVDWQSTEWNTWSIVDGVRIRTPKLVLLGTITKLFSLSISTWMTEVLANAITVVPTPGEQFINKVISVRGLFSAMLSASGLNPSYNRDDTTFVFGTQDLFFYTALISSVPDAAHTHHVGQLYVPLGYYNSSQFGSSYWTPFLPDGITADPNYLTTKYSSFQTLLGDMLKNFGVKMAITYDLAYDRYRIELRQNIRTHAGTQTFATEAKVESHGTVSDINYGVAAKCMQLRDDTKLAWAANGAVLSTTPPPGVVFNFETNIPFDIPYWDSRYYATSGNVLLAHNVEIGSGDDCPLVVQDLAYYDYPGVTYRNTQNAADYAVKMEEAIAGYNCFRFSHVGWRKFVHVYGHITADDGSGLTFGAVDSQKRRVINDGVVTRNYFANKVDVDPDKSELRIEWLQENFS